MAQLEKLSNSLKSLRAGLRGMLCFSLAATVCGCGGGSAGSPGGHGDFVGTFYYAIAVADLNNDGLSDIAAIAQVHDGDRSTPDPIWLQILLQRPNTSGRFTLGQQLPLDSFYGEIALGDLDGDQRTDVVVTDSVAGAARVYLQDAVTDGQFELHETRATMPGAADLVIADIDLDDAPDLVIRWQQGVLALLQDASAAPATFAIRWLIDSGVPKDFSWPQVGYAAVSVGDLNSDGLSDIAIAISSNEVRVLLRDSADPASFLPPQGYGLFSSGGGAVPTQVYTTMIADIDGDGADDLLGAAITSGFEVALSVKRQNPALPGTYYANVGANLDDDAGIPRRISIADVNADGRLDVVVGSESIIHPGFGIETVLEQTAATFGFIDLPYQFASTLPGPKPLFSGLAVADFNGDGLPDIVMSDGALSCLFNDPADPGTFAAARPIAVQ